MEDDRSLCAESAACEKEDRQVKQVKQVNTEDSAELC